MCGNAFSTSCFTYWREFCWKNLVRFFATPKIKTYSVTTVHTCWRKCGNDEANHYHIFWSCPGLWPFWNDIVKIIQQILGQHIPLPFTTLFLSDLPDGMAKNDKYLLRIMSAAAKKAITRKWLQSDPPTTSNWLEVIKEIHQMERLTFLLRLKRDLYYARWEKWMAFLTNEEGHS